MPFTPRSSASTAASDVIGGPQFGGTADAIALTADRGAAGDIVPALMGAHRALGRLENASMAVVALALFATMLLTVVDVFFRYVLNAPLAFAYDFVGQYLLVAAFFLALAYTLRVNGHMSVDMLPLAIRSARTRAALRLAGDLLALVLFVALVWASTVTAWTAWLTQEVDPQALSLPVWLSRGLVPLGCLILVLRLLVRIANDGYLVVGLGRKP